MLGTRADGRSSIFRTRLSKERSPTMITNRAHALLVLATVATATVGCGSSNSNAGGLGTTTCGSVCQQGAACSEGSSCGSGTAAGPSDTCTCVNGAYSCSRTGTSSISDGGGNSGGVCREGAPCAQGSGCGAGSSDGPTVTCTCVSGTYSCSSGVPGSASDGGGNNGSVCQEGVPCEQGSACHVGAGASGGAGSGSEGTAYACVCVNDTYSCSTTGVGGVADGGSSSGGACR